MSGDKALDFEALHTQLNNSESGAILAQVERAITHKSDWFAEPGASRGDVETGWRHILALHRKSVEPGRELEAAQQTFQEEGGESAQERLFDIRKQLSGLDAMEAAIGGYGVESGRPADPIA